jgi:Flp pilus assembly protein TadG
MKSPFIRRPRQTHRSRERGVTIALMALAMFAIITMAAVSIDVVALYLTREEAQRSADAAALAAARVLSITGVTGDPDNIQGSLPSPPWQTVCTLATQVAQTVASQNSIGSTAPSSAATVNFLYNGTSYGDCSAPSGGFAFNPQVQVQVVRQNLPVFFARRWGWTSNQVSATATAEAFNSSNSGSIAPNGIVPANPRCVKPWIVPNLDPSGGNPLVYTNNASLYTQGIRNNGAAPGEVGERVIWTNACGPGGTCPPTVSPSAGQYVPALVTGTSVAYPNCADGDTFQQAVGGCDQSTTYYSCGTQNGAQADLSGSYNSDTNTATQCLIRQGGQDTLDTSVFPYQIQAGSSNPVISSGIVSSSTSIATLPIYDQTQPPGSLNGPQPNVTVVGFLQVFINQVYPSGNLDMTILNVAGCGNGQFPTAAAVNGTSPVPIRLITPP